MVVIDIELQKEEARDLKVPVYKRPTIAGVDANQAREIARGLLEAQNPRIAVGRLRTPEGVSLAVQLADLVGASTDSAATQGPMSFPQGHRLYGPGANTSYDYTLGLEAPAATVALIAPSLSTLLESRRHQHRLRRHRARRWRQSRSRQRTGGPHDRGGRRGQFACGHRRGPQADVARQAARHCRAKREAR
jgi:hypothetical protein